MSYKLNQQPLAGESYTRCNQIVIDNKLDRVPAVEYHQELVFADQAGVVSKMPIGHVPTDFDPIAEIPLINPETGEFTGAIITQAELMVFIYSAYIAAVAPKPAEEEQEPEA